MQSLTEIQKNDFCLNALALKKNIETNFIELGAMLARIRDERLYESGWESWSIFALELRMSETVISRLINIFQVFHVKFNVPVGQLAAGGGWSVLAEYLPLVNDRTTKKDIEDWVYEAATLTRADVRKNITEFKKGVDMSKCDHLNSYKIMVCPDCGDKHRL
jgi:hypothetical protein